MLLYRPLMRLVVHFLDPRDIYNRHGDLFIEIPDYEKLITYEVESYFLEILKKKYKYYYLITKDENISKITNLNIPIYSNLEEIYNQHSNCDLIRIPLKRKKDHRKEYMHKEGKLKEKGKIESFTISYISGIVISNSDMLIAVDYE